MASHRAARMPEVVEAHRLFGDPDFLLRVDVKAYERFYAEVLSWLPGVAQLASYLAMKVVKADGGCPLTEGGSGELQSA
ncbi:Lrp/AsnC ligand binding domain-containing protein [Nonomuraea aurantiaca]|uniref:Lrp/AsnC ligand binding domain-containing protein n=1 Tax=Nonomuraea aurantiaca TaxID=2878562 RepID=UPI0021E6B05C|nr:Lrp/AsnC ligand binding domain-containing protein [Nonomuraea aurantiaca]